MGLWGLAGLGVIVGYNPPKRPTKHDHLTFLQKLGCVDLIGGFLLTAGLTMVLVALNLGGVTDPWKSSKVLVPLILGVVVSGAFGIYEWKGTTTGLLPHEMFSMGSPYKRTLIVCFLLITIEGAMLFSYVIFYPVM